MKKVISLIVLALLPMVTSLQICAYDFQSGGIYYSILSNNTVSVSSGNANYSGNVIIPSSVKYNGNTYNVTTIANSAFLRCSGLTNVTIPNSVTYIGTNAFNSCSGLTSVTIPNSVETIAEKGFAGCSRLTSVTIGSGVSLIGPSAFNDCNSLKSVHITDLAAWCKILFDYDGPYQVVNPLELAHHLYMNNTEIKDLIIPQGVTSISDCAFRGCSGLTSVTIPNSVTSIGNTAFDGCIGLTSITIPNSLTSIGSYAFSDTGWYNNQSDGILYLNKWVICYKGDKNNFTGSVSIAEGTKGIADDAFSGCSGLTSVTIPNSLTSIGSRAFSGCSGLTSITIPNSVTSIGYNAFYNTGWYKNQSDGILYLNKWVISYKGNCSGSLSIAEGTKGIAESAFYYCSGLTSVTIPNSVTIIRSQAFYGCYSLTSIVSEIKNPFKIEDDVFYSYYDTYNTATLTVPAGTKSLYQSTAGWKKFKNIVEASGGGEIGQVFEVNGIYYIIGENNTVSVTSGDTKYNGDVTIPEQVYYSGTTYSVKTIGVGAFEACRSLTSITIPSSISSIEYDAFYSCISLTSVHITDLEAWCKIDFSNADSQPLFYAHHLFLNGAEIEDLTIPNSVTSIKDKAFYSCSGLTSVTIPNSVTSIEGLPFSGCSSLISIVSEIKNPFKIEEDVFYSYDKDIYNTVTLTVPAGTKSLYQSTAGWNKFKNIVEASGGGEIGQVFEVNGIYYKIGENNTVSVTLGEVKYSGNIVIPSQVYYNGTTYSVAEIGDRAFENCTDLRSVSIPNSVKTIERRAFQYCSGLTSIMIPNSVTNIGYDAFAYCSGLGSIKVESGNSYYDSRNNCNAIIEKKHNLLVSGCKNTVIPNNVEIIGTRSFQGCSGLTSITIPNSVTSIQTDAFVNCSNLRTITIPNSVVGIGEAAFYGCKSLTSFTIPNTIKTVSSSLLGGCISLTSVTIPESVTYICEGAFQECTSLETITIPSNVAKIEAYAFYNCSSLRNVISKIKIPFGIFQNVFQGISPYATLTVPNGSKPYYEEYSGWTANFSKIVSSGEDEQSIVVTANSYSREYGDENPYFDFNASGANLNGTPTISCEATKTSPVGTYPIKIAKGSVTNNNVTYVDGTLTITKAPLTVTAKSYNREQGQENPKFEVTYSGFKNGENESVLTIKPTASTTATLESAPGNYDITVSGGEAHDYDFIYKKGVLTVTEIQSSTFEVSGISYLGTGSSLTAEVLSVNSDMKDVIIPASVSYNGKTYQVTSVADNVFYDHDVNYILLPASVAVVTDKTFSRCNMGALIWNAEASLPDNVFNDASMGTKANFLLYVNSASYAPTTVKNVVVNGVASSVLLSDDGGKFYCPEAFMAGDISYTHNYSMETGGNGMGWETIAMPFNVQKITHSVYGQIVPFASYSSGSSQKPFWLCNFTGSGFRRTSTIQANEPYIIAMPNSKNYRNDYNLSGNVTFSAENVIVPKTPEFSGQFVPAFSIIRKSSSVSALNVNNRNVSYSGNEDAGSCFISDLRDVRPYEAYIHGNSTRGIFEINIEDGTTDMRDILIAPVNTDEVTIHTLGGLVVKHTSQRDFKDVWHDLPKGVYIVNGKKMMK